MRGFFVYESVTVQLLGFLINKVPARDAVECISCPLILLVRIPQTNVFLIIIDLTS